MYILYFIIGVIWQITVICIFFYWGWKTGLRNAGHYDYNLHYGCKECRQWDILQYELRQWDKVDIFRYARPFYDPNLFKTSIEKVRDTLKENGEYEKRAMGKFPDSNEFNKDKPQV